MVDPGTVAPGTIDMQAVQGVLTAFAAVIAALVGLWNAWRSISITEKVNDVEASVKALSGPGPKSAPKKSMKKKTARR